MKSEKDYFVEVMELLEDLKKYENVVLPLSSIAGYYAMRFLDAKDCAVLIDIENKILDGYDREIRKKEGEE